MSQTHSLTHSLTPLALLTLLLPGPRRATAQVQGSWEPEFNTPGYACPTLPPSHVWSSFPPPCVGQPSGVFFNAVHMVLVPQGPDRGKLMMWDWQPQTTVPYRQRWVIMDPDLPTSHPSKFELFLFSLPPNTPQGEQMCSGHAWTDGGDLVVAGGNVYRTDLNPPRIFGNKLVYIYRSGMRFWDERAPLAHDRWYPSVTTLGDGRVAITGGIKDSVFAGDPKDHTYEIYNPGLNSYQQNSVARYGSTQLFYGPGLNGDSGSKLGEYPRAHVIAEGDSNASPQSYGYLFVSHQFKSHGSNTGDRSAKVDIELDPEAWTSPTTWSTSSAYTGTGFRRNKGTSTLWPNLGVSLIAENTVVRLGGTLQSIATPTSEVVTDSVEACIASGAGAAWTAMPSLNNARQWPNLVLLADGSLFVVGGASNVQVLPPKPNDPTPVMASEILVPGNSVWNVQPDMSSSRLYHSTALLLPSGKVMTGGGEFGWLWAWNPGGRTADFQVFVPPYLELAQPRVTITQVPAGPITFSKTGTPFTPFRVYYTTPDGIAPDRVVLAAPGSVTHHFDTQQRWVELVIQGTGEDATGHYIEVYPPLRTGDNGTPIGSHAVPGYYMLFLLTNPQSTTNPKTCLGVPSEAAWIQLL